MAVKHIIFDWFYSPQDNGEEFKEYSVGKTYKGHMVVRIKEHAAQGEGDKCYYDVTFSDGTMERIFNINKVFYTTEFI